MPDDCCSNTRFCCRTDDALGEEKKILKPSEGEK